MVLNIEDVHLVGYSLKKLAAAGLVRTDQDGRHRLYEATESGDAACAAYRQTRESHLVESLERLLGDGSQLVNDSHFLRLLMGAYTRPAVSPWPRASSACRSRLSAPSADGAPPPPPKRPRIVGELRPCTGVSCAARWLP